MRWPVSLLAVLLLAAPAIAQNAGAPDYAEVSLADPAKEAKALADAIRSTNITDNVSIGPGIQFDAKGQNDKLKNSGIQNRGGKLVTVAPKGATDATADLPMPPYDKRG